MASNGVDSSVEQILKDILGHMGYPDAGIAKEEVAGQIIFSIEAGEAGRSLIGQYGDTVHALDLLVKKMVEKKAAAKTAGMNADGSPDRPLGGLGEPMFLVDVNGYRTQKIKDLQSKALMMAERARSLQYDVELSPMSAYERLIVHTTLQGAANIKTESQGEGRNRRVVIKYSA
jgi:predicted RNA-binding protein Jag